VVRRGQSKESRLRYSIPVIEHRRAIFPGRPCDKFWTDAILVSGVTAVVKVAGAGAVSILNYGTRLISILLSLGPEALGVAVLPKFSRMVSENGSAATLPWLSSPIVRLAFQHGAFLTRVVASVKVNQILVPISAFGLLLNAGLNLVFMRWYSVAGIAAATVVAQGVLFVLSPTAVYGCCALEDRSDAEDTGPLSRRSCDRPTSL
jgi:hypothetical protein